VIQDYTVIIYIWLNTVYIDFTFQIFSHTMKHLWPLFYLNLKYKQLHRFKCDINKNKIK